jgi:hypothetical protein
MLFPEQVESVSLPANSYQKLRVGLVLIDKDSWQELHVVPFCGYVKWWDSKVLYQLILGFDFRAGKSRYRTEEAAYFWSHLIDGAAVIS